MKITLTLVAAIAETSVSKHLMGKLAELLHELLDANPGLTLLPHAWKIDGVLRGFSAV